MPFEFSYAATTYFYKVYSGGGWTNYTASDPTQACKNFIAGVYSNLTFKSITWGTGSLAPTGFGPGAYCNGYRASDNYQFDQLAIAYRQGDSCPSPQVYNNTTGTCTAPPCPAAGTDGPKLEYTSGWRTGPDVNSAWASGSYDIPQGGCYNGCTVSTYNDGNPWIKNGPGPNGYYEAGWNLTSMYTGATCTGTNIGSSKPPEPNAPPPEKNRCPRGTKQVGLDSAGIPICKGDVPDPPKNTNTNTNTTTNADGSKTTTETKTSTNRDGSTTTQTTTTTTNADGSTSSNTTQTVGNTPSGTKGTDDSSDDSKNDLCKLHPDLNVCKNSQISGTCAQVSCDGDAIQCAIAREITNKNCLDKDASDAVKNAPQTDLGNKILSGTDPQASTLPSPTNATTINVATDLNSSGFGLPSQCLTDVAFQLGTSTWNFRASQVCDWILPLRAVMMIIASLVSYRIVASAVVNRS